ncbi:MAG: hypothetical protein ACYDBB_11860 [Armatimonadota bacterium]
MRTQLTAWACLLSGLVFVDLATAAPAPLATFTAKEVIGQAWPRTLVTYPLSCKPGQAMPDRLKLVDAEGREQPCQLWRVAKHQDGSVNTARISFMAELQKYGSYRYTLLPEKPATHEMKVTVVDAGDGLVLHNTISGVTLLPSGEKTFTTPLRFCTPEEALQMQTDGGAILIKDGIIPGPVQGILLNPGLRRTGGSRFVAVTPADAPKVTAYSCQVLENGPLFIEARIRYTFDNGGFYQLTARVLDGDPAIQLDEQYDLKRVGDPFTWQVVYGLSGLGEAPWKPDLVIWKSQRVKGHEADGEEKFLNLGVTPDAIKAVGFGSKTLTYDQPETNVCNLAVWYGWSQSVDYIGLVDSATLQPGADRNTLPFLAVIPVHTGNWRSRPDVFNGMVFTRPEGRTELRWPLIVEPHPNTLLHTGEYDPDLPFSFGRRQWALVGGAPQYHDALYTYRVKQGHVTLDDYKDWVLDWPADPKVTYPRLVFTRADVARIKPVLAEHPTAEVLKKFLYFQDTPDPARQQQLVARLFADPETIPAQQRPMQSPAGHAYHDLNYGGDWLDPLLVTRSNFRQTMMTLWSHDVDETLAAGNLTPEQQRTLRSQLAAYCYLLAEPDLNPRGSMVHLGNPNMPINRFFALTIAASLIPDHPMAVDWLRVSQAYVQYKLAMNTAPEGAWSELISYFMAGYFHQLQAAAVMSKNMKFDPTVARLSVEPSRFSLSLLTPPDPRAGGKRTIPGWGHEGSNIFNHWLLAAGMIRDSDPELAKSLAWAWEQQGKPVNEAHFMEHGAGFTSRVAVHADLLQGLPKGYTPKELTSTWLPGFGAVMRAHAGDPDETYLSYHQGYLVSHCDANQGDFVLHAKGAPLVVMGPIQYTIYNAAPLKNLYQSFGWHSRVHFGTQTNGGDWPGGGAISQVHATAFSDSADYLRGLGDYGPQRWTRQILFLKGKAAAGPNYFLFRDSFHNLQGDAAKLEPKWWFVKTAGVKNNVAISPCALDYTGPYGAGMHVGFLQPSAITAEARDARYRKGDYTVTSVGPITPDQDILVMLYPRKGVEVAPQYESPADGVAKITTSEGIDYAFLGRAPFTFTQGEVSFSGIAGAVRIYPTEVHLIISEGPGTITYKGVTLKSAVPVTKVIPLAEMATPRTIAVPEEKPVITFALNPKDGPITEVAPGVQKQTQTTGVAYAFVSEQPITFTDDDMTFIGTRGGLVIDRKANTIRMVLLQAERLKVGTLEAWGEAGPCEVTFFADRITGHSTGRGRHLYLTPPAGLDRLPVLVLDGQTYAPGTASNTLIVPILSGEHRFELRALPQPPIWRNWQAWEQ